MLPSGGGTVAGEQRRFGAAGGGVERADPVRAIGGLDATLANGAGIMVRWDTASRTVTPVRVIRVRLRGERVAVGLARLRVMAARFGLTPLAERLLVLAIRPAVVFTARRFADGAGFGAVFGGGGCFAAAPGVFFFAAVRGAPLGDGARRREVFDDGVCCFSVFGTDACFPVGCWVRARFVAALAVPAFFGAALPSCFFEAFAAGVDLAAALAGAACLGAPLGTPACLEMVFFTLGLDFTEPLARLFPRSVVTAR
ncbi:MAG: hypothetical protein JW751_15535 [Polyangiaceae bacterium]|nr:hypothetical protein [Polyangiaceae bacterium]